MITLMTRLPQGSMREQIAWVVILICISYVHEPFWMVIVLVYDNPYNPYNPDNYNNPDNPDNLYNPDNPDIYRIKRGIGTSLSQSRTRVVTLINLITLYDNPL